MKGRASQEAGTRSGAASSSRRESMWLVVGAPTCRCSSPSSLRMRLLATSKILRLARASSPSKTSMPLWLQVRARGGEGGVGREGGRDVVHRQPCCCRGCRCCRCCRCRCCRRCTGPQPQLPQQAVRRTHPPEVQLFQGGAVHQPRHGRQPVALQRQAAQGGERRQAAAYLRDAVAAQPELLQQAQRRKACTGGGKGRAAHAA